MPRTPKRDGEDFELDEEAAAAAIAEARDDVKAEEAAAAFFAAKFQGGEGEEGEAAVDEVEAEPVLGGDAGEADGGTVDSVPAEAEADEGSPEEEWAESAVEAEAEEVIEPVDARTAAEKRPTTVGGLTIITT